MVVRRTDIPTISFIQPEIDHYNCCCASAVTYWFITGNTHKLQQLNTFQGLEKSLDSTLIKWGSNCICEWAIYATLDPRLDFFAIRRQPNMTKEKKNKWLTPKTKYLFNYGDEKSLIMSREGEGAFNIYA